ncbi:MAG: ATP-binding cassette domain-containing protein [Cognatishimia sp.]|uniref:ATP-binding cassette domain-containing protein n=1 Tax=Cognatishimia sp. TaxID=2211648 RepID=UPI003B8D6107
MVGSIFPMQAEDLTVRKSGRKILQGVSVTLAAQGLTIVMGPNGAGKSTLLKTLHGMERLIAGQISWSQPNATAQDRQAFVFQNPTLMRRTVLDNVAYPLTLKGIPKSKARDIAAGWLDKVHLTKALNQRASDLSGGERQKMALVRALIREPELLFLDEPCANLDGRATRELEEMLQATNAAGTRVIMATHDLGQAKRLATDVLFLHQGRLLEHTPAEVFFNTPQSPQAQAFLNGDIVE